MRPTARVITLLALTIVPPHIADAAGAFDGTWDMTLVCPQTADGAFGYTYRFPAQVKDSVFHGENSTRGEPGWLVIDGQIKPDGTAMLAANGLTGQPAYTVGRVARSSPYHYTISARFEARRGSGRRNEVRECSLQAVR